MFIRLNENKKKHRFQNERTKNKRKNNNIANSNWWQFYVSTVCRSIIPYAFRSNANVLIHLNFHFQTNQLCFHRSFVEFKNITAMFSINVRITVIYGSPRHLFNFCEIVKRFHLKRCTFPYNYWMITIFGWFFFFLVFCNILFYCINSKYISFIYTKYLFRTKRYWLFCAAWILVQQEEEEEDEDGKKLNDGFLVL